MEIEQMILGAILRDNKKYHQLAHLINPDCFEVELHREVFEGCRTLIESGEQVGPPALAARYGNHPLLAEHGGIKYFAKLAKNAIDPNVLPYAHSLLDRYLKKQASNVNDTFRLRFEEPQVGESMTAIISEQAAALRGIVSKRADHFSSFSKTSLEIVESLKTQAVQYSTGYRTIDEAMGGGIHAGKAYAICARKKAGKTMLTGAISHNLNMAGVPHLFIACEMTPTEIQQRSLARVMGINAAHFLNPTTRSSLDFMKRATDAAYKIPNHAHYLKGWGMTFTDLKNHIYHACEVLQIKGFVLDYIQLIGGKPAKQSIPEFMDEVAQWIAEVVRTKDIFALVVAQINQTGNVRGSESIRLAFDQCYQLHRIETSDGILTDEAWIEMLDSRYTDWCDIGSATKPAFILDKRVGPSWVEI